MSHLVNFIRNFNEIEDELDRRIQYRGFHQNQRQTENSKMKFRIIVMRLV